MASRVLKTGTNQITQKYKALTHRAVDLVKYKSQTEEIIAHSAGTVVSLATGHKNNKRSTGTASYGNYVKIDHGNGYSTLYAHLEKVTVKKGQVVKQGQVIGMMGNTGNSYGAHLHFEVRKDNTRIDPTPYLEKDLPKPVLEEIHVKYKAYVKKWYGEVTDYNTKDSNGYAGVKGQPMTGLMVKPTQGIVRYRVHIIDGKKSRWLAWVDNYEDYAGIKGKKIDGVQMDLVGLDDYEIKYRVSPVDSNGYYDWVSGSSATNPKGSQYAGILGKAIDCIQIDIVKKG